MNDSQPETPSAPAGSPLSCTQPAGGSFMRLELAWGRVRRAWLRLLRPGYVRDMATRRLGECPGCTHNVLDPRDLKYHYPACGYWFREEDDPFLWRDGLGLARAALAEVVCASALGLVSLVFLLSAVNLIHPVFWLCVPVVAAGWAFVLFLFRDPERDVPSDPDALVSPADGTVVDVGEVRERDFPGGRAFRVAVAQGLFDVHVTRMPRTGQVVGLRYFPKTAPDAGGAVRGEQVWVDVEETSAPRRLRVKQVASRRLRRVVCRLRPGETVWTGGRFGMIKCGARVEVLVPTGGPMEVLVKKGDRVQAGSTALLRFAEPAHAPGQQPG